MKRWKAIPVLFLAAVMGLVLCVTSKVQAEVIALQDGEYNVDYNILKAENDSVSMANDYFEKPAVIHVNNGKLEAVIRLNHSAWITEFKVPDGGGYVDTTTVSSDSAADTRVARFPLQSLESPLAAKIHVTVPSVDYDHDYTIRFAFDSSSITPVKAEQSAAAKNKEPESSSAKVANAAAKTENNAPNSASTAASGANDGAESRVQANVKESSSDNSVLKNVESGDQVVNPPTADTAPIAAWVAVFAVSLLFLLRRLYLSRSK
ncbi:heme uptake protein IsdC [Paenibacillus terreus]|uniref:Heme uptake protein IsdC n=1 Tax=Paenibacillus terreus TaxID=1387834 RepID=A0ABV5BFX9_9BACL